MAAITLGPQSSVSVTESPQMSICPRRLKGPFVRDENRASAWTSQTQPASSLELQFLFSQELREKRRELESERKLFSVRHCSVVVMKTQLSTFDLLFLTRIPLQVPISIQTTLLSFGMKNKSLNIDNSLYLSIFGKRK